MVAVDTNVLVYAHRREAPEHGAANQLMRSLARGESAWAIPWPCVFEFYSVVTNTRIWKAKASTPAQCWAQLEAWFEAPRLRLLAEPDGFASILEGVASSSRVRGPVIHDGRVAAICVAHGVTKLLTRDRDFALFPQLKTENPFG